MTAPEAPAPRGARSLRRAAALVSIAGLSLVVPPAVAAAAPVTLYVTVTGKDSGNVTCSQAQPCATLRHAVSLAAAGDSISLGAGDIPSDGAVVGIPLTVVGQGSATDLEPEAGSPATVQVASNGVALEDFTVSPPPAPGGGGSPGDGVIVAGGSSTLVGIAISGGTDGVEQLGGEVDIDHSTLSGDADGVDSLHGTVTLDRSTISGAHGDGVVDDGSALNVLNSTITGALVSSGGGGGYGIDGSAALLLRDSTVVGNQTGGVVADAAGGLAEDIVASTVAANGGAGIAAPGTAPLRVAGSVIAGNATVDCSGDVVDGGYNLSSDGSCGFAAARHDRVGVAADLGLLGDNGGPTATEAPSAASPAAGLVAPGATVTLDPSAGGSSSVALCAGTDQRGVTRPDPGGTACDAGAVELAPTGLTLSATPRAPVAGQKVTLVATATGAAGLPPPAGSVAFERSGSAVAGCGAVSLRSGGGATSTATCTVSLPVGSSRLGADAVPTDGYSTSAASLTETVGKDPTKTSITATPTMTDVAAPVTLRATVRVPAPGTGTATGTVAFLTNGKVVSRCRSVVLRSGTASCRVSFGRVGVQGVTADYGGSATGQPSSAEALVTVRGDG